MISSRLKELASARERLASLESAIQTELAAELRTLPAAYGFPDANAFIEAVRAAAGGKKSKSPRGHAQTSPAKPRRKRAVVTDETRASVKRMVEAGKTGGEIAKELGISLPTVQNIKKALGLVRRR